MLFFSQPISAARHLPLRLSRHLGVNVEERIRLTSLSSKAG